MWFTRLNLYINVDRNPQEVIYLLTYSIPSKIWDRRSAHFGQYIHLFFFSPHMVKSTDLNLTFQKTPREIQHSTFSTINKCPKFEKNLGICLLTYLFISFNIYLFIYHLTQDLR